MVHFDCRGNVNFGTKFFFFAVSIVRSDVDNLEFV